MVTEIEWRILFIALDGDGYTGVLALRNSSYIHLFAYFYIDMLFINVKIYVKIMNIKISISL